MPRHSSARRRVLALACAMAPLAPLAGCSEGYTGSSYDLYTYMSNEWQPQTVSLVDTRTGESVWSVDVPVGKKLVIGFRKGTGPNEFHPDMMYWRVTEQGRGAGPNFSQQPCPPATSRRLEPTLRPVPEIVGVAPGAELPASSTAAKRRASNAGAGAPSGMLPSPSAPPAAAPAEPKPLEAPAEPAKVPVRSPQGG